MLKTSAIAAVMLLLAVPARAAEIDACKYLLIADLPDDTYGIVDELRAQAKAQGFIGVTSQSEVADAEMFKACLLVGGWLGGPLSGQLAIRVVDAVTGAPIAAANISATNWWGIAPMRRGAVADIYRQLGYTGYKDEVYQARLQRLYPPRPKVLITEAQMRERTLHDRAEGIWTDRGGEYRLAIVASPDRADADYIAVVLQSTTPLWQPGEIKAELRRTESPTVFASTYFMLNKQPAAMNLTLEDNAVLRGAIRTPAGEIQVSLLRVWPAAPPEDSR